MSAGFFRRALSSLIDVILVIAVVYVSFLVLGRSLLQNQVENFDVLYGAYTEITDGYEAELGIIQENYYDATELAGDDDALKTAALADYNSSKAIIDAQYSVDIEPYNASISLYFMNCIIYFVIGFMAVMSIYTVVLTGKTLGRKILQVKLDGASVNPISVFFHDILFKYLFVIFVLVISPYVGIALFLITLLLDSFMITFTKTKTTLRDRMLKMTVVKTGYGY